MYLENIVFTFSKEIFELTKIPLKMRVSLVSQSLPILFCSRLNDCKIQKC